MSYFDLEFVGVSEVGRGDIEMIGCNLFDGRMYCVVVGYVFGLFRIFIIFISVGFVVEFVYGDSKGRVRFYGDGIVGYGISIEVMDNFGLRFDLVDRYWSVVFEFEVKKVVKGVVFDLFIFGV